MKKFLFALVCSLGLSSSAFAQKLPQIPIEGMPPYKIGLTAGFNASSFSASDFSSRAAFSFGVDFMLDASDFLSSTYLRTGLLLQMKGASFNWDDVVRHRFPTADIKPDQIDNDGYAKAFYIEIPIHYGYVYGLNDDWALLGETGPYLAIGLGGSITNPNPNNDSYKFFGQSINYGGNQVLSSSKRFDFGWDFAVSAMYMNQHQFKIGYQFGLLNVSDDFLQTRNLSVAYSYFFE